MNKYLVVILLIFLTGCTFDDKSYNKEVDELEQQVNELQSEIVSLDSLNADFDEISNEKEALLETITELSYEKEELEINISNLEGMNKELHYKIAELKNPDINLGEDYLKAIQDFDVTKYESLNNKLAELESEVIRLEFENNALKANYPTSDKSYSTINYMDGMIGLGEYNKPINSVYTMKIIGYGSASSWEHEFVDLTGESRGSYLFEIHGTLYDFAIQYIDWDYEQMTFEVREEVCFYNEVRDTDFLFNSILAEGIPSELISWKDDKGKEFYYLIGDPGLSGNVFPYIIISELVDLDKWWEN